MMSMWSGVCGGRGRKGEKIKTNSAHFPCKMLHCAILQYCGQNRSNVGLRMCTGGQMGSYASYGKHTPAIIAQLVKNIQFIVSA